MATSVVSHNRMPGISKAAMRGVVHRGDAAADHGAASRGAIRPLGIIAIARPAPVSRIAASRELMVRTML